MRSLFGTAGDRTRDLSIPSQTLYHYSTAPPPKENWLRWYDTQIMLFVHCDVVRTLLTSKVFAIRVRAV